MLINPDQKALFLGGVALGGLARISMMFWGVEKSICSVLYGLWTIYLHEWPKFMVNVGKYTIHRSYG